jgi:hypothetical protein
MAVEAAFSHLPISGPGKISWYHLWFFDLSYSYNDSDFVSILG